MHPFECSKCRKMVHSPTAMSAKCCEGATFTPLVNICLLVVEKELTGQPIVHQTGDFHLPSPTGAKWGTACGAKKLPAVTTRVVNAATCKKCLTWYNKQVELLKQKQLEETVEYSEVE